MVLGLLQTLLLAIIGANALLVSLGHVLTLRYFARYTRRYPPKQHEPPISVIKPTKGLDHRAEELFRRFCEQDYANAYEILFCVEDRSDPCVPVIRRIVAAYPDRARLIFSDTHETKAIAKMRNMIAGLAASSYDVVLFSDSDIDAPPDYLRNIVTCIADPTVGFAFSVHAYAGSANWVAALQSISASELALRIAPMCFGERFDGAVGSAMLTRKDVLQRIGGLEQFGCELVDDVPFARKVHSCGYRVLLLKEPARVLHRREQFDGWWWQQHRWRMAARYYWPAQSLVLSLIELASWWSLAYLALALLQRQGATTGLLLLAGTLLVSIISASITNRTYAHNPQLWRFLWVAPLYECLRLPLFLHSRWSNEIVWRGRRFRIFSERTTRLVEVHDATPGRI